MKEGDFPTQSSTNTSKKSVTYDHATGHRTSSESSRQKDFASRMGLNEKGERKSEKRKLAQEPDSSVSERPDPRRKFKRLLADQDQRREDYTKAWDMIHSTSKTTAEIHERLNNLNEFSATDIPEELRSIVDRHKRYQAKAEVSEQLPDDYVTRYNREKGLDKYRFGESRPPELETPPEPKQGSDHIPNQQNFEAD